jgi:hypothetical protein
MIDLKMQDVVSRCCSRSKQAPHHPLQNGKEGVMWFNLNSLNARHCICVFLFSALGGFFLWIVASM